MGVRSLEWRNLFRLYNLRMIKQHRVLYGFLMLSVIISVSIALAIPQLTTGMDRSLTSQAAQLNGAGLRVEAAYESQAFRDAVQELVGQGATVRTVSVYSSPFLNGANQAYGDILVGDYALAADEIILYARLADDLQVEQGGTVTVSGRAYRVKQIEQVSSGVDGQSELLGYGKVSSFDSMNRLPFTTLFLLDSRDDDRLKDELMNREPDFTYSTIADQKAEIQKKLNTTAATLTVLHTLSYLMTVVSVLSSIFMIIVHRQKDIAVIRMLSVSTKSVQRALRAEMGMLLLPSVLLGCLLSIPLAKQLLGANGVPNLPVDQGLLQIVGSGAGLFLLIYAGFVYIATMALKAVHPLSVIRGAAVSWKSTRRNMAWLSAGFTLITLIAYSVYLGRSSALFSSLLILVFSGLFFAIVLLGVKVISRWPYRNRLLLYSSRKLRANRYSFTITVVSLAFTCLFLLFGFTLDQTIRDSFQQGTEQKLGYNYVAASSDVAGLEQALKQTPDVAGYSKLYVSARILTDGKGTRQSVQLCELKSDEYHARYKVVEGADVFEGSMAEVLISSDLRNRLQVSVGDSLKIERAGETQAFRVKGIYEAGGMNQRDILKPASAQLQGKRVSFLVQADSDRFKEGLAHVITLHVGVQGEYLAKMIRDFLTVFKWLCFICIFSSVLFNLNLVYMGVLQDYREAVVIRALGIGKGFLLRFTALQAGLSLGFCLLLSLGLYLGLVQLVLTLMLHIPVSLATGTVLLPVGCAAGLVALIFLPATRFYRRAAGFEELRAMD
jgi:putative ABC transport system permease protein